MSDACHAAVSPCLTIECIALIFHAPPLSLTRRRVASPAGSASRLSNNLNLLALYQRKKDARQETQAQRVKELDAVREVKAEEFRRVIQVRPN